MPIGKVPQSLAMARKTSACEAPSIDSTIDSRMSHSELLPMELLKVNYVHQCKQAMMRKSNEPLPTPHLNNPARFMGYRRQPAPAPLQMPRASSRHQPLSPNSAHKPLPALPAPPTVESWLLLAKQSPQQQQQQRQSAARINELDCCCSQSACSCSDSNSDVTEASTVTPDCEKSQSWNYRDVRRDLARAGAAAGIKSRADRIARIERRSNCPQPLDEEQCVACVQQPERSPVFAAQRQQQPKSRIPKPTAVAPYSEANVQLQRRVQQLFQQQQQEQAQAPRWMFQKAGSRPTTAAAPQQLEQQSPRLQQKTKLERVHIRKKRQPLHIVNQLAAAPVDAKGGCIAVAVQGERLKRFSLESCSDSGVSSSNDTKEQQTKQTNLRRDDKCVDCVQVKVQVHKQQHYERTHAASKTLADPNDVQNFAKKSVTKASTSELLTAAVPPKQCNIEKERHLNNLNHQRAETCTTTTISIDDSWVQESCKDPCDDYMETDSLMLPAAPQPQPLVSSKRNSVKIFVSSCDDYDDSPNGDHGKHKLALARPRHLAPSSRDSLSSSGCGGSSRDNSSLCESEQDCCSCAGQQQANGSCASYDCCNTIGGVYWNNACYQLEADAAAGCCCSLSSCDEDDCSYYEGDFVVELDPHIPGRQHNNHLPRKTGIHELRPRSMDGVIDSGSLNGDTSSSPDNGEHAMQNQQDAEARRLKRGHVLSELLETERIYVNEMSSILKVNKKFNSHSLHAHYILYITNSSNYLANMRYGGYDLRKASKPKTPQSAQSSFRLRQVQNTACNIVGRFNFKFGDSLIRKFHFDTDEPRQSPLSFQGSLFDSQSSCGGISYRPADFRPRFGPDLGGNYIFGTNLCNFATHNILNGKSTIKIINTLQECEEREASVISDRHEHLPSLGGQQQPTVSNSLQRLKDQRRTIFKELIELSSCDESLEYRLVKDYLESNSYSEIENDTEFKDYLQRKNYMDILAYLEDNEPKSFMSVSSSIMRAQSSLGSLNNSKSLSTPKSLKAPKQISGLDSQMCSSCRSNWPNNLNIPSDRKVSEREKKNEELECEWSNNSYREVLSFCHQFFEENFKDATGGDSKQLPKLSSCKFKLSKYERVLKDFVNSQGYVSVEQYVEQKFGQFISSKLNNFHDSDVTPSIYNTLPLYCCYSKSSSRFQGYCDQMQSDELMHLVPASLQGKEDILFGNLHELYTFHNEVFLKDLENCISTTELVALCFVQRVSEALSFVEINQVKNFLCLQRDTFYRLYSFYCQNIPRSERLRETLVDTHLFLQECQKRLGHKLPLAAYLLKPVQRITKYQLLLKDLLRFSDSGSCTKELQKALDCMLIVLKCVNDSMHQVAITGFPVSAQQTHFICRLIHNIFSLQTDLAQQGELLLQDSFQVWTESKKDIRLRIKPQQRHIFLYQKSLLFCKQTSKTGHNKSTYQFKHHVKMSQIGLTESVRGDTKRFEVWLQGRQEVHTMQAPTLDVKNKWVAEIKRVLLNQLEELKGEKIKQYGLNHRGLKQTTSWDTPNIILSSASRTISCDASSESSNRNSNCSTEENGSAPVGGANSGGSGLGDREHQEACGWSSDYSNSEDELSLNEDNSTPGSKFIALADYTAMGHSEVSIREGEAIELLKVGCAGWWYVRVLDSNSEGWTPGAYLESVNRKSSRSSSCNQERINLK
ncbi:hypothetical protein KR093_005956 [Drosophila rubida]|uniref:Guanine nucleotide exchange factor DBS n=1 Tax=Drosophila rubida TaxID=30044 RepID=A0AAD4K207_9MUSC|nr:hypothetical protein KR093_005956 [Drosophila rubida]